MEVSGCVVDSSKPLEITYFRIGLVLEKKKGIAQNEGLLSSHHKAKLKLQLTFFTNFPSFFSPSNTFSSPESEIPHLDNRVSCSAKTASANNGIEE